jgi:hypothetical protein
MIPPVSQTMTQAMGQGCHWENISIHLLLFHTTYIILLWNKKISLVESLL